MTLVEQYYAQCLKVAQADSVATTERMEILNLRVAVLEDLKHEIESRLNDVDDAIADAEVPGDA